MQSANAKKFRAGLKEFMDAAVSEPVRINRRDGQSFILMSEQVFESFRSEIQSLQRRLLGMNEIVDRKTKPLLRGEDRTARFKKIMAVHFHQTSQFAKIREHIEDHLYATVLEQDQDVEAALRSVGRFAEAMDRLFDTLEQMYQSPAPGDHGVEKSFPVHNGRYRVFFKVVVRSDTDFDITLLDIDDNRQSNLDRFPFHRIIPFDAED